VSTQRARQCAGAAPSSRLNARLNASSEPYPTLAAISPTLSVVVSSSPEARLSRQVVR
jgi:hypothetical protein